MRKPLALAALVTSMTLMAAGCASKTSAEHPASSTPAQCAAAPDVDQDYSSSGSHIEPLKATDLTLCGYGTAPGIKLQTQLVVNDANKIQALQSELNKGAGLRHNDKCANDSGAVIIEKFQDSGHEVDLVQEVAGCGRVSNGKNAVFDGNTQATNLAMKLLPAEYCRSVFPSGACTSS